LLFVLKVKDTPEARVGALRGRQVDCQFD
jgi:hypothetical protein